VPFFMFLLAFHVMPGDSKVIEHFKDEAQALYLKTQSVPRSKLFSCRL
jgi:hypothetical protein